MKELKFLGKLFLFSLPFILLLGFPIWILYKSGELIPDQTIAAMQMSSTPIVVGIKYTDPSYYLKLQETLLRKPDVLILSDSRAEEIRSNFFKPGSNVYNAWSAVQKISHYRHFLDEIPAGDEPKVIMMVLDEKFFNPNYDDLAPDDIDTLLTQPPASTDALAEWAFVYKDYFQRKFTLGEIADADGSLIGVTAIGHQAGFRNDGSYDPGTATSTPEDSSSADYHFQSTLASINEGIGGMEYSTNISQPALTELTAFLAECRARHITVVGVLPPFAPTIYQKLFSMPVQYGYLKQLAPQIKLVFDASGFEFHSFIDPSSLGLADTDMIDGVHPSEHGALALLAAMAKDSKTLQRYTDLSWLNSGLNSGKEFFIYDK